MRSVLVAPGQLFQSFGNLSMMIALRAGLSDRDLSQLAVYRHQDVDPPSDRGVRDARRTSVPNYLHELFDCILNLVEPSWAVSAHNVVAARRPETRIERLIELSDSLSQSLPVPVVRRGSNRVVDLSSNGQRRRPQRADRVRPVHERYVKVAQSIATNNRNNQRFARIRSD